MNRNSHGKTGGILLIICGVLLAGRILHWFTFDLFFDGWWTLFLIVPNAVRFFSEPGKKSSALKGLILGGLLLMAAQGFISIRMLIPLAFAGMLILVGVRLMKPKQKTGWNDNEKGYRNAMSQRMERERREYYGTAEGVRQTNRMATDTVYRFTAEDSPDYAEEMKHFEWNEYANRGEYRKEGGQQRDREIAGNRTVASTSGQTRRETKANGFRDGHRACTALFSGKEICYDGERFDGAMLSVVFGAINLDLRGAVFDGDTTVESIVIFGGLDIRVPHNVRVVVDCTPLFGGVENHVRKRADQTDYTLYIRSTCVFGGVEIKG